MAPITATALTRIRITEEHLTGLMAGLTTSNTLLVDRATLPLWQRQIGAKRAAPLTGSAYRLTSVEILEADA